MGQMPNFVSQSLRFGTYLANVCPTDAPRLDTEDTDMEENAPETKAPRWPYTSWKTVFNLITRFEGDGALPPRIDRSVLGGSEGQKTQTMAGLRFLGLIGENGQVTPLFQQLVSNQKERPQIIRGILEQMYPEAIKRGKENATTKQLEETFTGLSGDTLRKAMTFYLHAAKFAGVKISPHFKIPSGFRSPSAARKQRSGNGSEAGTMETPATPPAGTPVVDAKARYLDMLLDRASKDDQLNTELLDRIEKLLGYPPDSDE